jgi:hypothetical protein
MAAAAAASTTKHALTDHHDEDEPASPRATLAAVGVLAALVLGALWLSHVLGGAAKLQDCVASGRTNCAPVGAR